MGYDPDEIQAAFDRYRAAADKAGRSGDWQPWVDCFTPDVHYIEHMYGEFHGRAPLLAWITKTMQAWPFNQMQLFPWDWFTLDAAQGWVIGQVENRFVDPGDGRVYQAANWTRLVYGGDGLFASEEDVYNPAHFGPMVTDWLAAYKQHHESEAEPSA